MRLIWIIGFETQDNVAIRPHEDNISSHRYFRHVQRASAVVKSSFCLRAVDHLERMPVKVERMLARVVVVQNDLNGFVFLQDECMCVYSVHLGIRRRNAS